MSTRTSSRSVGEHVAPATAASAVRRSGRERRRRVGTHASLGLFLLLAACSKSGDQHAEETGESFARSDDRVACALAGARDFSESCTAERSTQDGAPILAVRHPDGGFRRFELREDGGLAAADGADRARVSRSGEAIEVAIGNDRYRFGAGQLRHGR
jgi:hypothetical protein